MESALVVVGGGPGALSAARAYRAAGGTGRVQLFSADLHPPYNRPPMSKDYLRGESEAEELSLEHDGFYAEQDIELLLARRATALIPDEARIVLEGGDTVDFGQCVLATGSTPAPLAVRGGDHPELLYLRSRTDAERLRRAAEGASAAIVIGSGFIGCEAAASLAARGLRVTMISTETRPQADRLGTEAADHLAKWLFRSGVRFFGGVDVEALRSGHEVVLANGEHHAADFVLIACGVRPQVDLGEAAGLVTDAGRIVVDQRMRTSDARVFAVGDVAFAHNAAAGRHLAVEHWGDAERMGEVAGTNAAGGNDAWTDVPGFWSEIGAQTLKYAAWGDGFDEVRFVDHEGGAFTAWYGRDGKTVGVLTHAADEDYDRGRLLVENGEALPAPPE